MGAIEDLLRELTRAEGSTQKAVGDQLGVSESTISQCIAGGRALGLEPLLRLAAITGKSPALILDLAGKADTLELLESSFGPAAKAAPAPLPRDHQRLLDAFALLTERDQAIVVRNIMDMQPAGSPFAKPHAGGAHHRVAQRKRAG